VCSSVMVGAASSVGQERTFMSTIFSPALSSVQMQREILSPCVTTVTEQFISMGPRILFRTLIEC
jgi:hypothetical protein